MEIDGKLIYHAGDLNWWHWEGEEEEFNRDQACRYQQQMEKLKQAVGNRSIDLAFVPVDPRLNQDMLRGVCCLAEQVSVEKIVRENGAVPATIAIIGGKLTVGCSKEEIERLGKGGLNVPKVSRRDIPFVVAKGQDGATTVAATMYIAHLAGIDVLVKGGKLQEWAVWHDSLPAVEADDNPMYGEKQVVIWFL